MDRKRFFRCFLVCFALLACLVPVKKAQAANPTTAALKPGTIYKSYDVTGDGKKDRILVKKSGAYNGTYRNVIVYINGKKAYSFNGDFTSDDYRYYDNIKAKLYTLKNGKPFLYLYAYADNEGGPVCALFQYKSGKLTKIIDFHSIFRKYGSHLNGSVTAVSGNSIKANFRVMSWSLGPCEFDYTYTYQSGTLKRTSRTGSIISILGEHKGNRFTVNRSIAAYKSAGSSRQAFTLKKGNRVKIGKCWMSNGKMYIQVTYGNKSGWIKAASSDPQIDSKKQFSDVCYAG